MSFCHHITQAFKLGLTSTLLITSALSANTLDDFCDKLTSENYADRKNAASQLYTWAWEQDDHAKEQLAQLYDSKTNPELKARLRETLKKIIRQENSKGFMGIQMSLPRPLKENNKDSIGVEIREIVNDGPAQKAGLKAGDLIIKIDELELMGANAPSQLSKYVKSKTADSKIQVSYKRNGQSQKLTMSLGHFTQMAEQQLQEFLKSQRLERSKSKTQE